MEMDDLEDIVLDEIALEGLNGVSLERLWILLEQRKAPFPLQCDDHTKNFIWQDLLCQHHNISFYSVPEEFQQLNESVVEEKTPTKKKKSSKVTLQSNEAMIDDPETKDRGYCLCYKQRTNVTAEIRKEARSDCLSLQQVTSKWGNSLVLVASREARLRALVSQVTTADVPLQSVQYCCLEHVGRCRYLGASQPSLSIMFDVDLSYVFHMCKILLKHGVVIKETTENLAHIYLIRFKPESQITRKTKVADKILDFLANQPNKTAPRYELVEHLLKSEDEEVSYNQFKKALRVLKSSKMVEAVNIVAKELPQFSCPEVTQSLAEHLRKIKDEEGDSANTGRKPQDFIITCIRLMEQSSIVENDVEDNEDDDDDADLDLKGITPVQEIDFSRLYLNLELTDAQQVYYYVERKQNELNGVSINEVMHALMMDRYRVRVIFKRFSRQQLMKSFTFMTGRVREMRFFTQRCLDEGTAPEQVLQLYHQGGKKAPIGKRTSTKVDDAAANRSSSDAGGSSDHLESSPGGLQPTSKSKKVSKDKEPGEKSKGFSKTWKNLERSRLIIEHMAYVRVIEVHLLLKHIKKTEAEMGSKTECCRKSLFRMLINLSKEGKLNYFTKDIQRKDRAKKETIKIVSDASIGENDPQVQALLDNIIIKPTFAPQPVKMPVLYRKLKGKPGKKTLAMSDLLKSKMQHTHEKRKIMERYGYTGKMERLDALHKFLWYILYEKKDVNEVKLEPLETLSPGANETWETSAMTPGWQEQRTGQADIVVAKSLKSSSIPEKTRQTSPDDEQSLESEESSRTHVERYLDTTDPADWRRYVPPGKGHLGRVKGWATMNDILSSLPLSLYVKINSVLQPVPGLDETLQHPRMRHYPINVLRLQLFHWCDIKRTINNIHTCLVALSGMGLIYFDRDQRNQLRNQVNFYLCRSGSYLDTTSSAAGYDQVEDKEYPRRTYTFSSLENVTQFWLDFKMTCFSTPLGVIKQQSTKLRKENKSLILVADSIHEAPSDPLTIPGDHRGAGGLDTIFYAHRSGNWDTIRCRKPLAKKNPKVEFVTKSETENDAKEKDKGEVKVVKVSAKEHKKATAGGKGQKRKTSKGKSKSQKGKAGEESRSGPGLTDSGPAQDVRRDGSKIEIANQKGKKVKKVKTKSKSKSHLSRNLHIYDSEDLLASQRKVLRRVKWSAREDNLLLLCGLSLRILKVKCAKSDTVKRFVAWAVVRDLLQENLEESFDKTAAAAARRFRLLLKDYTNMSNFSVCLTDIHADKEIMTEFMSRKRDYDNETVRQQEFRELCMTLAKKFESQDKSEILALPSTLEELYEKYDLMNSNLPVATTMEEFESKDVKSEEEITFSILFKIVLISMLSHHFRQHDMKEIYFALRQYDTAVLQKAVDLFKSHGFMGRNRNGIMDTINTKRAMHVVPMSFQFTKTFFNLFNAPSIPVKILGETSSILGDILTACKQASDEASLEGGDTPAVCIDDMRGNKSSILCIPALDLASDTVDIPKDIISLELSPSERVHLQKKHEEEMMQEVEEGDLEEEDEDDGLSEKPREAKRKASEMSEDVGSRKMIRQLVGDIARRKVAFVRTAHKEWRQTLTDKQASEPEKTKGGMSSLIPRLLVNMEKQKTEVDSTSSKAIELTTEPVVNDLTSKARRSLALDHDYFIHEAERAPETSQDDSQSEALCQQTSEEAAAPSPNTIQVDDVSSPCKAPSEEEVARDHGGKASDSFFTWLTMRGFLTQEYSKKPQNIHEDITVRRCSIHLKPNACLLHILNKYHVSSKQEPHEQDLLPEDSISQRHIGSQPSNPGSKDQLLDTKLNTSEHVGQHTPIPSRIGTSQGKLIPHEKTSGLLWHSESKSRTIKSNVPGHVQSLGELICHPCGPIQAFQSPTPSSDLRPIIEYTIKEPCRGLEDIRKGHTHSELMRTIYQLVRAGGSLGLTYPRLLDSLGPNNQHTRGKVFNSLRVLLQEQLILEVGTTVVRLVAQKCASNWLLKSVKSIVKSVSTPPESSGLVCPTKKARVSEQSISQAGVTNGEGLLEGALSPNKVDLSARGDTNERLQESSIAIGGERLMTEGDKEASEKEASEKDGSHIAETMAADGDVSSLTSGARGRKRKQADKKDKIPPEVRYEPVTILSHPWTNIDGSVNTKSITMFVSSLGLLVISKPGIKESDVFHHFQNVMAPVECLHLIKILMNADIITRHTTYSSMKLNLFGPPSSTKPKSIIFYQPLVGALMNLALLKDNLAQSKAS